MSKKYDFIISKNLAGIGIWALGYDDGYDKLWNALGEKVGVKSPPSTPEAISISSMGSGVISIDVKNDDSALQYDVVEVDPETSKEDSVGKFLKSPFLIQGLNNNEAYYYKVRAINEYGSSEFTEILGASPSPEHSKVLIINGFDRTVGTTNTFDFIFEHGEACLLYTSPSPRDKRQSRMPSSA